MGQAMPRCSLTTPQVSVNLGSAVWLPAGSSPISLALRGVAKARLRKGHGRRKSECARMAQGAVQENQPWPEGNTCPETSLQGGGTAETYLYNAEAALFSPLGLLGLGSPAMLISAMNKAAALHGCAHREPCPTADQGKVRQTHCAPVCL